MFHRENSTCSLSVHVEFIWLSEIFDYSWCRVWVPNSTREGFMLAMTAVLCSDYFAGDFFTNPGKILRNAERRRWQKENSSVISFEVGVGSGNTPKQFKKILSFGENKQKFIKFSFEHGSRLVRTVGSSTIKERFFSLFYGSNPPDRHWEKVRQAMVESSLVTTTQLVSEPSSTIW